MGEDDGTVTVAAAPATGEESRRVPELNDIPLPSRFCPLRILGSGAMGYVVEARDQTLGRDVAVKVIVPKRVVDARSRTRFLREARAVAVLRHANIVTVHDLDPLGKFLVMELVRGETLKHRIERSGALPLDEVRRIGKGLLAGLAAAHDAGIVHRDVKPANLLLGDDGSVKLADFGVAATSDSELTKTGEVIGTPAYMAPEQLRGHGNDPRVDIYAAGATLFEAATGERLHPDRDRDDTPQQRILGAITDRDLAAAIARAVSEQSRDRFPDARAFASALEPAGMLSPAPAHAPATRRRTRWTWLAAGAAVLAASAGVVAVATRDSSSERAAELQSSYQRGLAALEQQDFATAEKYLRAATREADAAQAHYHLAIAFWSSTHPTQDVLNELDKAIDKASPNDARLPDLARSTRKLVSMDYPAVIAAFEELGKRYATDRDVLYGQFEALFHGGRPVDAMAVYRRLRAAAPSFTLGRHHALAYWLPRGDLESTRWALGDAVTGNQRTEHIRWEARIDAARGDFAAARQRLAAARATAPERAADELGWELVAVDAAAGEGERAHELAVELSKRAMHPAAIPMLGIAIARGNFIGTDSIGNMWKVASSNASVPATINANTRDAWSDLAAFIVIDGNVEHAKAAIASLPRDSEHLIETAHARSMMACVLTDRVALERHAKSVYPDVRAIAEACVAELANDHAAAIAGWQRVLVADGFGRFRIATSLRLARQHALAGDDAATIAVCDGVIRPKLFHWSWGAAVGECLQLSAAAHRRAGRLHESHAASRRILDLRVAAPVGDQLVAAARANIDN